MNPLNRKAVDLFQNNPIAQAFVRTLANACDVEPHEGLVIAALAHMPLLMLFEVAEGERRIRLAALQYGINDPKYAKIERIDGPWSIGGCCPDDGRKEYRHANGLCGLCEAASNEHAAGKTTAALMQVLLEVSRGKTVRWAAPHGVDVVVKPSHEADAEAAVVRAAMFGHPAWAECRELAAIRERR